VGSVEDNGEKRGVKLKVQKIKNSKYCRHCEANVLWQSRN
jgi:hypothetical protein